MSGEAVAGMPATRSRVLEPATVRRMVWVFTIGVGLVFLSLLVLPLPGRWGYVIGQWMFVAVTVAAAIAGISVWRWTTGL
jgi:hypothetical protein